VFDISDWMFYKGVLRKYKGVDDMNKHTEGPWGKIIHEEDCSRVGATTLIAKVYSQNFRDRENQEANAHLIAAAPIMYEGLSTIARDMKRVMDGTLTIDDEMVVAIYSNCVRDLEKAEGAQ